MLKFIASFLLFVTLNSHALNLGQCKQHEPYDMMAIADTISLCRTGYLSHYDPVAKIPRMTSYSLTPEHVNGCVRRSNKFAADSDVQNGPMPSDYSKYGFDRGHLSPDDDMAWDVTVERESFLMTNMVPQAPSFNRGIWKILETNTRSWVLSSNQSYIIMSGSIYSASDSKMGDGIVIPHAFFKIVINQSTHEVAGWMFPHSDPYPNLGNDLTKYRVKIADIELDSGIRFNLPIPHVELDAGKEWKTAVTQLNKSKAQLCKN